MGLSPNHKKTDLVYHGNASYLPHSLIFFNPPYMLHLIYLLIFVISADYEACMSQEAVMKIAGGGVSEGTRTPDLQSHNLEL